ncbi:MAG: AGE family epimerase/isomerase [Saprospiraceae bacterium]
MTNSAANYCGQYKNELLENILPFWQKNSVDQKHGGFFTCLLQDGTVFDTDKFIWLQARQVWTYSMLYNRLEQRQEWLDMALHGSRFLEQYGRDSNGSWYFSLDQYGQPLIQAYNIFSDCFATMAFGQLYQATQVERYAQIAKTTFEKILKRQDNPKGIYTKAVAGTRPLQNFALPMILCNLALEIEHLLEADLVQKTIDHCIHLVMDTFYDKNSGLTLENVDLDGQLSDSFEGRLLNPGHAIEAMWFIMDLGVRMQNTALIEKAKDRMLFMLEYGWDQEMGGIYYFLDRKGYPPQQLEWNQKLWWVHLETLVALLKGFQHTKDQRCWTWFERVHEYTWKNFADPNYGEWLGYLQRDGSPLMTLKGGKWKGCFHVPRGLFQCWKTLETI